MYEWWYTDGYDGAACPGWSWAGDARRGSDPTGFGAPAPALGRDQRLQRAVVDALLDDPAVTGGHIDLSVQNGVVILDGDIDTEATHSAAVARAWSVAGVADVCDALAVTTWYRRRSC